MSRTIRRLKPGRSKKRKVIDYVKDLEGKEFDQAFWKFHTDNGLRPFSFENSFEYPFKVDEGAKRVAYKKELEKWMKNPDHEIQFSRFKLIWDLC